MIPFDEFPFFFFEKILHILPDYLKILIEQVLIINTCFWNPIDFLLSYGKKCFQMKWFTLT